MTGVDDLVTWLGAQLDEDERAARAAIRANGDDGRWSAGSGIDECRVEGEGITVYDEGGHTEHQARHIATWDPARVLAEVDAKRRVLALIHEPDDPNDDEQVHYQVAVEDVVKEMATPYADRPGYRDEWRP